MFVKAKRGVQVLNPSKLRFITLLAVIIFDHEWVVIIRYWMMKLKLSFHHPVTIMLIIKLNWLVVRKNDQAKSTYNTEWSASHEWANIIKNFWDSNIKNERDSLTRSCHRL